MTATTLTMWCRLIPNSCLVWPLFGPVSARKHGYPRPKTVPLWADVGPSNGQVHWLERCTKMVNLSSTKLVAAIGGLLLSSAAGIGVASAEPDLSPLINTTCSYPQVVAALNATSPAAAAKFQNSHMAQGWLQQFLASPQTLNPIAVRVHHIAPSSVSQATCGQTHGAVIHSKADARRLWRPFGLHVAGHV